ncbi:conjugative transposon protein TraM [Flavobacterium agrisoli]|uniref:Conjugative transposon protein TraM n=1 Tax=Flavobacterium agrisoli TaxID=2793066 RepID=A0A934PKL5_9FLAO|nr:conjugative transposon protein TraM [Flavobacterium agrisoli]MBK0368226.1 conjugative transposon protein TraM [Flavobacterium agrisoli]
MEEKTISAKEAKKRKMLFVLPLITLPFITLLFYTLGGGKMEAQVVESNGKKGFNFELPLPKLSDDSELDKMSYYHQAAVDSLKLEEQYKKDPNYSRNLGGIEEEFVSSNDPQNLDFPKNKSGLNTTGLQDNKEQKVYEKLRALEKAISRPEVERYNQDMNEFKNYDSPEKESTEVKKLEELMSALQAPAKTDPELQQLGGMLENILDIQHPERVEERLKQGSETRKGKSLSVTKKMEGPTISTWNQHQILEGDPTSNAFFTLEQKSLEAQIPNAIEAVIHQTQTIVNGSVVKLRLKNDIAIEGKTIPKNTFLYGMASLKGERLEIKITAIQYQNSIFPVDLAVYDLDGIEGVYIPGAINRDVAKASADRSIQTMGLTGISDSWGAQAAGMGIEAAKSLMSKKVKLIKVVVKAGYQVLLSDEKQKIINP